MTQFDLTTLPPPRAETVLPGTGPKPAETGQYDGFPVPAGGLTRMLSYLTNLACAVAIAGLPQRLLCSPALTDIATMELIAVLTLLHARIRCTPGTLLSGAAAVTDGSNHAPGLKRQLVHTASVIPLHVTVAGPLVVSFLGCDGGDLIDRVAGTAVLDLRPEKPYPGSGDGDEETEEPLPRGQGNSSFPVLGALVPPSSPVPVASPLTPCRVASQEPAPAVSPGNTQIDLLIPRRAAPPPSTSPKPSPVPTTSPIGLPGTVQVWLVADSGQREEVDSVLVVGRESTGTSGEHRLVISDSTNSISWTYLRLGPASDGVWMGDATSTNRTVARNTIGAIAHLVCGRCTLSPPGTMIIMGKRTMITTSGSS